MYTDTNTKTNTTFKYTLTTETQKSTVKPVLRGHLWDKEKGDLLIQVTA